jgi:hypothetical protein
VKARLGRVLDKLSAWAGQRPMRFIDTVFMDKVTYRIVNLYRDRAGRYWLAHGSWSLFRVAVEPEFYTRHLEYAKLRVDRKALAGPPQRQLPLEL